MNLPSVATDNITELLFKIIEFTQTRQKVLIRNINEIGRADFIPKDLPVKEFCCALNTAIDEHIRNQRLVLQDTENIKFGTNGSFTTEQIKDWSAQKLLNKDCDEYVELQINKLLENSLNQRIAAELLKHKQSAVVL